MTALPARERRYRESRRALQAAAIALVDSRGFSAVTVDDIAARAGVSRRTFFNHFPTKAAALFDPDPDDADRLAALLTTAHAAVDEGTTPWPALQAVCVSFVAGHESVIAVRRQLVAQWQDLDAYHRTAHHHVEVALQEWTAARSELDPFTSTLMAQAAATILTSAFASWRPEDGPDELPRLVDRGFALLAGGFGRDR